MAVISYSNPISDTRDKLARKDYENGNHKSGNLSLLLIINELSIQRDKIEKLVIFNFVVYIHNIPYFICIANYLFFYKLLIYFLRIIISFFCTIKF